MKRGKRFAVLARGALLAVCVGLFETCAVPAIAQTFAEGGEIWGGEHVELRLDQNGGDLTFDCGSGHFSERLKIDGQGRFTVNGTYTPEYHGPVRDDIKLTRHMVYAGTIRKDTMTLQIQQEGSQGQSYSLKRGKNGAVTKCR